MKIPKYFPIFLLGFLLLSACGALSNAALPGHQPTAKPASSDTTTPEPDGEQPPSGEGIVGEKAIVEEIQVLILESFPVQVNALMRGSLPNGCTTIQAITSSREGNTFNITILTERPVGAVCSEALIPFEESVSLDVAQLLAGTYTVKAYDQTAVFTLQTDNVAQEPATCPEPSAGQLQFSRRIEQTGAAFCFLFPQDFNILGSGAPDFFQLIGPQYGEGPEPVSAGLTIATINASGRSLQQYVQEKLGEYPDMTITPEDIALGSESAISLDEFPGRLLHRMVFAERNGLIYELAFSPADEVFPEAKADMERLYESAISSWTFPD
jgi:hypothetical protein